MLKVDHLYKCVRAESHPQRALQTDGDKSEETPEIGSASQRSRTNIPLRSPADRSSALQSPGR